MLRAAGEIHRRTMTQHTCTHKAPLVKKTSVQCKSKTYQMIAIALEQAHVLEAVLADPEIGPLPVLVRVRAEVPRVDLVAANADTVDVAHSRQLQA